MNDNQGIMRIGEVHTQLRKYFPDIELSKIRYYEDKGLVQPSRSRKGYRLYSSATSNACAKRSAWRKRSSCHYASCDFD